MAKMENPLYILCYGGNSLEQDVLEYGVWSMDPQHTEDNKQLQFTKLF